MCKNKKKGRECVGKVVFCTIKDSTKKPINGKRRYQAVFGNFEKYAPIA